METKTNRLLKVCSKQITMDEQPDGTWLARCPCRALQPILRVRLSADQVKELFSKERRPMQTVLPEVGPKVREVFISGLTPAEFDLEFCRKLRPRKVYADLGYDFE